MYKKGSKVWIPNIEKVWEVATIVEDYENGLPQLVVKKENSNETITLNINLSTDLPPLYHPDDNLLDDKSNLTSLTVLHEATILNVLRIRFERYCVYNNCGIATVVLNPYTKLSNDESDKIQNYRGQTIDNLVPHMFAVAEKVYCRLERESHDQSIIFSGETGAGKTENAEKIILYLATIGAKESQVKEKILASSIILQAFGNAKTIKNNNSSRFGKFMEMEYDKNYHIIGASVKTYFLDRSRIIAQAENEQNYNIFYQLCSVKERFSQLQLDKQKFNYLNQGNHSEMHNVDNIKCFEETIGALNVLGFSDKQQDEILRILAAILYLGNLNFIRLENEVINDMTNSCFISNLSSLQTLVKLFSLEARAIKAMRKWLRYKRILYHEDEILQPMTVEMAVKARNTLAKFVYTKLFNWIVARINALFRSPCHVQSFVGVLDFYGFEKLNTNSFEQFCINYANERIQQYFVQSIFKSQQEMYMSEDIGWEFVNFKDNRYCLELIEGKYGIIDIIDEETKKISQVSQDSCISWINNLHLKCAKAANYEKSEHRPSDFIILHFIDKVEYDTTDFLEKNRDTVIREQLEILKDSKNDLLGKLVTDEYYKLAPPNRKRRISTIKRLSLNTKQHKKTVITEIRSSLTSLLLILKNTTAHYVRCIKTNDKNKALEFNPRRVAEQLQAFGILETIKISALGFFNHLTYGKFFNRYHCLCRFEDIKGEDLQENCRTILATYLKNNNDIKYGKTKVFLSDTAVQHLEQLRASKQHQASVTIQKTIRRFLQQNRYREIRRTVLALQRHGRRLIAQRRLQAARKELAATKIQAHVRGWSKRRWYRGLQRTALELQNRARLNAERDKHRAMQMQIKTSAATEIQRLVRGYLARRNYVKKLHDVIVIQSCVRRFLAKIAFDKLKRNRDERITLMNRGLERKITYLQEKIDYLMKLHIAPKKIEELQAFVDDEICVQAKNRILSEILSRKVETLKGLYEAREKARKLQKIECKKQEACKSNGINNRNLYEDFKVLLNEEENIRSYQQLFQSLYNFNWRAEKLKRTLGLKESDITNVIIMNKSLKENSNTEQKIDKSIDERNNNTKDKPTDRSVPKDCKIISKEDTLTRNSTIIEYKNNYEGMLHFNIAEIDILMNRLIVELDPLVIIQLGPEIPAQILIMCIRYLDTLNDNSTAFSFIQCYLKTVKQVIKQRQQFDMIVLWIANTHQLLNYLKQYSKINSNDQNAFHLMNTSQQNKQCLKYLDLIDEWETLYDAGQWMVRKALKQMKTRTLELIVPALLETEEIIDLKSYIWNSDQENHLSGHKLGQLLIELTKFDRAFKKCGVHSKTTGQIFKQLFEFLSTLTLNNIMSRKELCTSRRGMIIRCNVRVIERWATNHQLLSAREGLHVIIQATRLFQIQPLDPNLLEWINVLFDKLNSMQIMNILNRFVPDELSGEIPVPEDIIKGLKSKLTDRELLTDTMLIDAESGLVNFPFKYSNVCLEEIEIPTAFNLSMLTKI